MITYKSGSDRSQVPFRSLVPFLLVAFGLAWGILASFIFLRNQMTALFGELTGNHPLFFLAVYSPAIAAFIVVIRYGGVRGLGRYFTRLSLWRCSRAWYAFLFIGIPLLFFSGSAMKGNLFTEPFPFSHFRRLSPHCYSWPSKAQSKSLAGAGWHCLYSSANWRRYGPG
ncbi:MAG: hypothetical protein R6V84_16835 [Desulfobacterales bacterium]